MRRRQVDRNTKLNLSDISNGVMAPPIHANSLLIEPEQATALGITEGVSFAIIVHDGENEFIYSGLRAIRTTFQHWRVDLAKAELVTARSIKGGGYGSA